MQRDENEMYHLPQAIEAPLQRAAELAAQGTRPSVHKSVLWRDTDRTGAGGEGSVTVATFCATCGSSASLSRPCSEHGTSHIRALDDVDGGWEKRNGYTRDVPAAECGEWLVPEWVYEMAIEDMEREKQWQLN